MAFAEVGLEGVEVEGFALLVVEVFGVGVWKTIEGFFDLSS